MAPAPAAVAVTAGVAIAVILVIGASGHPASNLFFGSAPSPDPAPSPYAPPPHWPHCIALTGSHGEFSVLLTDLAGPYCFYWTIGTLVVMHWSSDLPVNYTVELLPPDDSPGSTQFIVTEYAAHGTSGNHTIETAPDCPGFLFSAYSAGYGYQLEPDATVVTDLHW